MNIENRVIFYLVFFIVMQVITSLSRKYYGIRYVKPVEQPLRVLEKKEASLCNSLRAGKTCKIVFVHG